MAIITGCHHCNFFMDMRSLGFVVMNAPALTLDNVTICYDRHPAIHHISGSFEQGSLTAIVGHNGAGKSTLLQGIMGILPLQQGKIIFHVSAQNIAYLPQRSDIEYTFPMTVIDTVILGHWNIIGAFKSVPETLYHSAQNALKTVGLIGFDHRPIQSISSGQFQRMLFARMILQDSPLILLDEPFVALDMKTVNDLLSLLHHWHEKGKTIVAVLHDLMQVHAHFPQALLLAREKIAWGETKEVLSDDNLNRAQMMAENWKEYAPVCLD